MFDHAAVHDGDAVGHHHGLFLIVRHHQGRDGQALLQRPQFDAQVLAHPGVQGGHGFVQQQQGRRRRQRARQGHALLLAAGDLSRIFFRRARQAHQGQHLLDPAGDVLAVGALAAQAVGHVLGHGQVGKQRIGLEQDAVVALLGLGMGYIAARQHDGAAVLPFQPGDGAQQRRLPATRRPQQAHQLSGADIERNVSQRRVAAESLHKILH
ncbi:hypothetical protein D3C72_1596340 [compost metagenome]